MPTRERKVRRMRGSRTHGYGQVGQHRHSGKRGGHGNAGLHKHKWTYTVKYAPDHFGRDNFRPPVQKKPSRWINVGMLDQISGGRRKLNLTEMGYEKLLGSGKVSFPYEITVESYTERAKEKIEKAGGMILEAA